MSEWQPIETAPRDGTAIIVALRDFADGWIVGEAYFDATPEYISPLGGQKWWWANQGHTDYYATSIDEGNHPPTHWMPLPKPPVDAALAQLEEAR